MKQVIFLAVLLFAGARAHTQQLYKALIRDVVTQQPLEGVSVTVKNDPGKTATSNTKGIIILASLPVGKIVLLLNYTGYQPLELRISLPDTTLHLLYMQSDEHTLNEVTVVSATRSNDRIENATTKVEVLGLEEMNEESTVKPGNIASILGDVSGVQIQQSSAVSGNANVRIQGLDGRYTQILRDGMPLYGGYAGGFGVLSIPPLDLKQVELIKGSSSTLYGGGAIGGLINLVSKKPTFIPDASFLVNQTTLNETNLNAYYAQRWHKAGFTLFAGQLFQKAVDVNKDGFSDVPKTNSTLIHPVFYYYPSTTTTVSLGWSGSFENRTGGDMIAVTGTKDAAHPYFEKNKLNRNTLTLLADSRLSKGLTLTAKGSLSIFDRTQITNTYDFKGTQRNYYGELSLVQRLPAHNIVAGINTTGDVFKPSAATPVPMGRFTNNTIGLFAQDTWQLWERTKLEAGLRADHHDQYGNFVLPRLALFHHFSEHWGGRAGFGMGYTTPNPLTPQIRDYSIYQLQPVSNGATAEKSVSGNMEVNYKKEWNEEASLFINHAFFITRINHPFTASEDGAGNVSFSNQAAPLLTQGFDTYLQLHLQRWEFYLGYTYTEAIRKYLPQHQFVPVTPRNRAATTLVYEIEDQWRIGLEASYTGTQYREDYSKTPAYLFAAAMIEKKFGPKWSIVLNCENLFDERQSKYEALYSGSITLPSFATLWAPIDGRVTNLCIRFKLAQ
jgi:iron complex outermembrane receptor protein/outer membrane receptor for ferrienterochelin and colicins